MSFRLRGVDAATSNETYTLFRGRIYRGDTTRRAVIVAPGGNSTDLNYLEDSSQAPQVYREMADKGYPLNSADGIGHGKLGNDSAQDRIGKAWTKVKSALNTKTDKMLLFGISGGATAALNYARANPSNVAAMVLIVPGLDLTYLYNFQPPASWVSLEAVYTTTPTGNWVTQYAATHDPAYAANKATAASQAIPTQIHYGTLDVGGPPDGGIASDATRIAAYVASVPHIETISYAGNHLGVGPLINPDDVLEFLEPYA